MTQIEKIDAALESILQHICYDLEHASLFAHNNMRDAMRKIMEDSFNDGIASTLGVREEFIKNDNQN